MTDHAPETSTNFASVDPALHVARSAASLDAVNAMGDALAPGANNMGDYFHEDFAWRGNVGCGTKHVVAEFRRNWQLPLRAAFADHVYVTERTIADADWAGCFGHIEATHIGTFMDIAPTGKRVRIRYLDFWQVEDGRIKDHPVSVDFASVCLQLGRNVFGGEGWEAFDRNEKEPPRP